MSKGLDTLEYIKRKLSELEFVLIRNRQESAPYISETIWYDIEKELKALETIKEKRVNVYWLLACSEKGGLERYNNYMDMLYLPECNLTQEQFDLLLMVLL